MIRIWLGAEDIARTRIAPAPLPLHEVFVSLAAPRAGTGPNPVGAPELTRWLRDLREPAPPPEGRRSSPNLPDPVAESPDPVAEAPVARGTAPGRPRPANLLAPLPEDRNLEGALEWLLTTSTGRVRSLAAAVRAYYDQWVVDELSAWESVVRLDVNERSRALATGGVEALLALLDPWANWRNPVLSVGSAVDLDLRPAGAGLLLVPSVFARQLWVGGRPESVVVVYPVRRPRSAEHRPTEHRPTEHRPTEHRPAEQRVAGHRPVPAYALGVAAASGDPLTALLGRSRAAVLRAALVGANTTDLARRAGISTPSASQHASVLRDAGLLRTTRHGKAAHHTLTPLARALLTGYDVASRR